MATNKSGKRKVVFNLTAPDAQTVILAADFNGWGQQPIQLKKQKNGNWKTTVNLEPGEYQYRFIVNGLWFDDPACSARSYNPYGTENCIRVVE